MSTRRQRIANPKLAPLGGSGQDCQLEGYLRIAEKLDVDQEALCISYTELHEYLAAGFSDGTVKLYKENSTEDASTLRDTETIQNPAPVTAIARRPVHRSHPITSTITVAYANGCVKCWHYPSSQCLYTIREGRQTLGIAYHPYLSKFVTVGEDAKIYLYDEESKVQERVFHGSDAPEVMDGHKSRIFSACFNPKSVHEFISGGWDDTVQFWDTRQAYAIRHISGVHMCGDGLDISRNGKEILTCAWQRKDAIQLWDYSTGRLIVSLDPDIHSSLLYCGKYINNLFITCGGTDENLFRIVDLRSHATVGAIRNLSGGTYSLDVGLQPKHARKSKASALADLPRIAFCAGKAIFLMETVPD